jgi:hypothetical protein
MIDPRIIAKIRKTLALAENAGATPAEAIRAATQAEALLRKYNLEMADIIMEQTTDEDVQVDEFSPNYRPGKVYKSIPPWVQSIAVVTAKLYDCHARFGLDRKTNGQTFRLFGYSTDLQVCRWTIDYLTKAIYNNTPTVHGTTYANDFRKGATSEICRRLRELKTAQKAEYETSSSGTALVVFKEAAIVKKFGDFTYKSSSMKTSTSGASEGRAFGATVNITTNRPITNQSSSQRYLTS